jgi:hypothetical protein
MQDKRMLFYLGKRNKDMIDVILSKNILFSSLDIDVESSNHSSYASAMTIVISIINKPIYYSFQCMRRVFLCVCVVCLFITLLPVSIDDITKWHRLPAFISRLSL